MKNGISKSAKDEILRLGLQSDCCKLAFLSAAIHTAGSLLIHSGRLSVVIKSSNPLLKKALDKSLDDLYGITSVLAGSELTIGGENMMNILSDARILSIEGAIEIISGIDSQLIQSECCAAAYVRGAFVGSGSVSALKSGYHMEFSLSNEKFTSDLIALLATFGISAKHTIRKEKHIVYLKGSEAVCDCLALTGAAKTVLKINTMFVDRYVRQLANRQSNCDLANLDRAVSTGLRQAELFQKIVDDLNDEKLKATAEARINNHDASYDQLANILNISKGGIKHRLKKLEELAKEKEEQPKK